MALNSVGSRVAIVLSIGLWMAADAAAVQVVFTLVPSQSDLTNNGDYGGLPFLAQDDPSYPTPGVTDGDPTRPSNQTSYQGTITVDVDNVLAPTTIQILSASIDALSNGSWLPDGVPGLENEQNCEDNPGGPRCSSVYPPDPAEPADIGVKLWSFGGDVAYGALRDLNYNLKTEVDPDGICEGHDTGTDECPLDFAPVVEPVNPQGEFSSLSQHFTYNSGYFDTWQHPGLDDDRDRDPLAGDSLAMNQSDHSGAVIPRDPPQDDLDVIVIEPLANAQQSTYVVAGNLATLTIPVNFVLNDSLSQSIDGQFVATFEVGSDGDHNEDGFVNAADYPAWRKIPALFGGDPAGYAAWRTQFGEPAPGGSAAVPEPAAAALFAVGFTGLLLGRRWPSR